MAKAKNKSPSSPNRAENPRDATPGEKALQEGMVSFSPTPAYELADEVQQITIRLEAILGLMADQVDDLFTADEDQKDDAQWKLNTLLECANHYLANINRLCQDGEKDHEDRRVESILKGGA